VTGRRVAVTGMGCVCASGNRIEELRSRLRTGRSGVSIEGPGSEGWVVGPGPVDFEGRVSRLVLRRLDETMRKALHAALQAVDQARLSIAGHSGRLGVVVGTGFAGTNSSHMFIRTVWEHGPEGADPSLFPNTVPNGPAGQLAIRLKARGPGTNFFDADTAGENALDYAMREIRSGSVDSVVVCGVDERSEGSTAVEDHYRRARGQTDPRGFLRPYDAERSGVARGDASVAVLLEAEETALLRGVEPLAVLGPVALGAEATPPGSWPKAPESLAGVAVRAVRASGVEPDDLAFVTTAARGSREYDAYEAAALKRVESELKTRSPVCAPMGYCGSLCSSGVFRLVVSILGLREGMVPATARLRAPDPGLGALVSPQSRPAEGRAVLQVGSGAGAAHAALVVTLP